MLITSQTQLYFAQFYVCFLTMGLFEETQECWYNSRLNHRTGFVIKIAAAETMKYFQKNSNLSLLYYISSITLIQA